MTKVGHHISADEERAYRAPFPDDAYKAGMRRFPAMIMVEEDMPGVQISKESRHFFAKRTHANKKMCWWLLGCRTPFSGPT